MDLPVIAFVWDVKKKDDIVPLEEDIWSPSTFLQSSLYNVVATNSHAAEDKLAFDQAFRNFQRWDTIGKLLSSCEPSNKKIDNEVP
jgi:hypothetical protein